RRGHLAHPLRPHVDPGLDDHRVGHGLAGRLVLEAHRHDDVVAFLDLRLHRLEYVVVCVGEHRTGPAYDDRDGGAGREKFPSHFSSSSWMERSAMRPSWCRTAELAPREASAHALRHILRGIRLGAVDKADWPSANGMDCLQKAVPLHRSATEPP